MWQELVKLLKLRGVETLEFEARELDNIFALLLLGSLVGLPQPPTGIVLRLTPLMVREMAVMSRRAGEMDDFFGEVAGLLTPG